LPASFAAPELGHEHVALAPKAGQLLLERSHALAHCRDSLLQLCGIDA
jgi:hypothetical protein